MNIIHSIAVCAILISLLISSRVYDASNDPEYEWGPDEHHPMGLLSPSAWDHIKNKQTVNKKPKSSTNQGTSSGSANPPYPMYCENTNDDRFFNKCLREYPPAFLTILANFIKSFINPLTLGISAVSILFVLPLFTFGNATHFDTKAIFRFRTGLFILINFIHRLTYSFVLDVSLYALFRQHRPCLCTTPSGSLSQVGSIYGLPSGDAMAGSLLGMTIIDHAPFNKVWSRAIGFLIIIAACFERTVLGMHSFAQVTVGASLGILLYLYSTRSPQFTVYLDTIVLWCFAFGFLYSDPALDYPPYYQFNLTSWVFGGFGYQFMVLILLTRFYYLYGLHALKEKREIELTKKVQTMGSVGNGNSLLPPPVWYRALQYSYHSLLNHDWKNETSSEEDYASAAEEQLLAGNNTTSDARTPPELQDASITQQQFYLIETRKEMFRTRTMQYSDYAWVWISFIPLFLFQLLSGAIAQQDWFAE